MRFERGGKAGPVGLILGSASPSDTYDTLLMNDGAGHLTAAAAGTIPPRHFMAAAGFVVVCADLNNDGWPDIVIEQESTGTAFDYALWLNRGDGTFVGSARVGKVDPLHGETADRGGAAVVG